MNIISTRGHEVVSIDQAIIAGLAPDGGLYVPQQFPHYVMDSFYKYSNLAEFAYPVLTPFFSGSAIEFNQQFCDEVFSFPLTLKPLASNRYVLELFHGPTLSFKDFGARFFVQCLQALLKGQQTKVLVATSGDTGSAVASALSGKKDIEGIVLFPKDKISLRQQAQITCWEDNIHALAVKGTFDDCQKLVKGAFTLGSNEHLTTANSINIARLLPQLLFYAYSSIQLTRTEQALINFIVPSGNLGNVTACYWAKQMGFPIGEIRIATNANHVVSDFLNTGTYQPRQSVNTLANAMDVGNPSNLERVRHLFPEMNQLKHQLNVESVNDGQIKAAIKQCYQKYDYLICPHTATAYHRLALIDDEKPWVMAATAHPAKFEEVIEPLLDLHIAIPEQLKVLLAKPQRFQTIEPDDQSLSGLL